MAFPFYKSIDSYIVNELKSRTSNNNVKLSKLVPWIKATSSLDGRYSIGTDSYSTLFDGSSTDAYGNQKGSEWRYRPNPIITDFSVDFASRGTLRRCTLKIKCFTPDQLTMVQQNFLEPGISCYVQWGWNYSVEKGKAIGPTDVSAGTIQKYNRNADELNKIRAANYGCYDNFVGIIGGGESNMSGLEFDVTVKMVSLGEILMGKSGDGVVTEDKSADVNPQDYGEKPSDSSTRINWYYFYQQLPDELRTSATLKLIDKLDYNSDFINYNEDITTEAKEETSDTFWGGDLTFQGRDFEAADSESPINAGKFVSFDAFIKLLNSSRLQFKPNNTIDFNIDIKDTYIGAFSGIFSTDERIYIPNKTCYNYLDDIPLLQPKSGKATIDTSVNLNGRRSFPKTNNTVIKIEGSSVTLPANKHGWIGDVYIENEMAMEALKNQSTPVKEVLDGVLKKMEDAVEGLWAFQILEEKNGENVSLRIADSNLRNVRNGKEGAQIEVFDMFGTNSFFLDASFNLDIPKSMASKVYMEKSTDGVQTTDELTGLFSSKKDIVLGKINKETAEGAKPPAAPPDPKQKWIEFRRNIKILPNPLYSQSSIDNENMNEWAICSCYLNKRKFNDIRKKDLGYSSGGEVYNGRSLPVGFDFTVLGMSGFQVGHLFNIKGLPEQYNSNRGAFQVEEITHKIDGKQWITEVKSNFRPFYK